LLRDHSIDVLDLSYSASVQDRGRIQLARLQPLIFALSINRSLVELRLQHQNLDDDFASLAADMLLSNETLNVLDLAFNCIQDYGGITLASALPHNYGLEVMNLEGNPMSATLLLRVEAVLRGEDDLDEETAALLLAEEMAAAKLTSDHSHATGGKPLGAKATRRKRRKAVAAIKNGPVGLSTAKLQTVWQPRREEAVVPTAAVVAGIPWEALEPQPWRGAPAVNHFWDPQPRESETRRRAQELEQFQQQQQRLYSSAPLHSLKSNSGPSALSVSSEAGHDKLTLGQFMMDLKLSAPGPYATMLPQPFSSAAMNYLPGALPSETHHAPVPAEIPPAAMFPPLHTVVTPQAFLPHLLPQVQSRPMQPLHMQVPVAVAGTLPYSPVSSGGFNPLPAMGARIRVDGLPPDIDEATLLQYLTQNQPQRVARSGIERGANMAVATIDFYNGADCHHWLAMGSIWLAGRLCPITGSYA
jgi:hypothetical protein